VKKDCERIQIMPIAADAPTYILECRTAPSWPAGMARLRTAATVVALLGVLLHAGQRYWGSTPPRLPDVAYGLILALAVLHILAIAVVLPWCCLKFMLWQLRRPSTCCSLFATFAAGMATLFSFPSAVNIYGRFALTRMLDCQVRALKSVPFPFFLNQGSLLGSVRSSAWITHDRLSEGNGDIDLGVVVSVDATADLARQLRNASHHTCGHFIITRDDWFSKCIMSRLGYWGAYGVRLSLLRIYSPLAPFVYLDVDDYVPHGNELRARNGGRPLPNAEGTALKFMLKRSDVLPLSVCSFEGIAVPCPGTAVAVLEAQYGQDWRVPKGRNGALVGTRRHHKA
jgi:hypothetical protein